MVLGLVGSVVGSCIFWALGVSAGAGLVAFVRAVIVVVVQCKAWAYA
jgi:uncharacterized membrane protein YeaQ/YmgE (transglycosylase-associated protein family)